MTTKADLLSLSPDHLVMMDGSAVDEGVGPSAPKALTSQNNVDFLGPPCCRDVTAGFRPLAGDGRLELADSNEINTNPQFQRIIGGWIRTPADYQANIIAGIYKEGSGGTYFSIAIFPTGAVVLLVGENNTFEIQARAGVFLEPNRSYHFLMLFDGDGGTNRFNAYIDGVPAAAYSPTNPQPNITEHSSHGGDIVFGDPDTNINYGGEPANLDGPTNISFNAWFFRRPLLSDTQIREFVFERQALPDLTISADTVVNMQAALNALSGTTRANSALAIAIEQATDATDFSLTVNSILFNENCSIEIQFTGISNTLTINQSGTTNLDSNKASSPFGGNVVINAPPVFFIASQLVTPIFNNIKARLSLVPNGPPTINDDGSISAGAITFAPTNVNTTNNTIVLTGIAGKLNSSTIIRFFGSDLPEPIDNRGVYYPSADYTGNNNLLISTSPGGATLPLTDTGSIPVEGSDMFASCWTELDINTITTGAYSVDLSSAAAGAGVTLSNGDIITLQAIHHDSAGTGPLANISEYLEESFEYTGQNISSLRTLALASNVMSLLQEIGLDGSQVAGYSQDAEVPSKVQIDFAKTDIDTRELAAFYYYTHWTDNGLRIARGNINIENLNSISIRGELTFDAASRSVMGGAFLYRLDGKNIVAPESAQISFNWQNTRAAVTEVEVPVNLPESFTQAIQSILYLTSQIPSISTSGGGLTTQQIRDSLKLSPSPGEPSEDSIDDKLNKTNLPTIS